MQEPGLIRSFSNIGQLTDARRFTGFPSPPDLNSVKLTSRACHRIALREGSLLSLSPLTGPAKVLICAIDGDGQCALARLNLTPSGPVRFAEFESGALRGWAAAHGLDVDRLREAEVDVSDLTVFKGEVALNLWVAQPVTQTSVVEGASGGDVLLSVSHAPRSGLSLPEPLGAVREEFTVSRGTARAYALRKGEYLQIIDVEGQQCSDFMAFRAAGLDQAEEWMIDGTATRSMVRSAYPAPGLFDKFFDARMQPMLRVVQDTCGRHDTFGLACTARGYEDRGFPGHVNCSDNISGAMAPYGVRQRPAWPAINFFWNTWVEPNTQHLLTEESYSRPGDYVAMHALDDLVCVSTACPDDLDPINGWNPTDVHVRIYRPDAPIRRAVAYRVKEDAPMSVTHESAFHARTSALTKHYAVARDLWMPVSYPATGTIEEYWACREKVTLQDMSPLRKYDVVGPDAEHLLQLATTRNVARLAQWRGTYTLICDDTGAVIDDGTLFRLGPDLFRWCCGAEESARALQTLAQKHGFNVRIRDMSEALVNLALQGPRSRDVLKHLVFTQPTVPALEDVKWFGVTIARLKDRDGAPFMLSRSGYTGELGYEIFCAPADATRIWDALMEAGAPHGITPMGGAALEVIRIEAGLAAAGAEFTPDCDALEAGLGFAVDFKKADFVGRAALERNAQSPRRVLKGLRLNCNDLPVHGAPVMLGERQIGQITSATRSPMLETSIAMARLAIEHAETGTELEIGAMGGHLKRLPCTVVDVPFFDPKRERARA